MKRAVKVNISGTVQGVFFRQFIADSAKNSNIRGFVRNLENGDVEAIAEGENEDIEKFIENCRIGPKHANIRGVKFEERKFSGDFKEFKILRF